ncbi:hypothetical protein Hanom_Chr06g00556291 [Helianthus anomalus]
MKVMGETVAPSDNEVDLRVFGKKPGNLLEKIFEASSQRRSMALGYLCLLRDEGVETDWESCEATPPHGTQYTRSGPCTSGGRDHSVSRQGLEFAKLGASGSWMTHNPSCDHLPHIPRWNLVQGSRMDNLDYCHDFYSLSFPLLRDYIKRTTIVLICWIIMFNRV